MGLIKFLTIYVIAFVILSLMLFGSAGTLNYPEAWTYIAIIFIPALFVVLYFAKTKPQFLERRMQYQEKEEVQKKVIDFGLVVFIIGFLMPGLDQRFGLSHIPEEIVLVADILVFAGYIIVVLVFKENEYASRTIQVERGQRLVDSGPYSYIRHPMYLGTIIMYLATPIALGSYWAVLPFLLIIPMLRYRIKNEEEVLNRELPGYPEYCKRVKYRIIPFIW
jgi:protein-S-isoprenylcysteine O-methyltransferase Ste14